MGFSQSPSPPHQYSEAIQLKLYQAFIFSIPILFAIILILLFYLFYLKRRASGTSNPPVLPTTRNDATITTPSGSDLKDEVKSKLCAVLFDECMKTRDSQCCVCLGEYEEREEVVQVPSCKHVFHMDCIRDWLRNNSTCPLCRSPVIVCVDNPKSRHHHPTLPAFLANSLSEQGGELPQPEVQLQHHSTRSEGSSSSSSNGSSSGSGSRY